MSGNMKEFKKFINKISSSLVVVFGLMIFNAFKLELKEAIKFCLLYVTVVFIAVLISYFVYRLVLKNKKHK